MDSASRQMSKSKALELLKQLINEIPQLRTLNYGNKNFKPWRDRVKDVISLAFNDDDYQKFSNVEWRSDMRIMGDAVHQSNYQYNLTSCKTALQSIIDKYEILGIERERSYIEVPPESIFREVPPKAFIVHGGKSGVLEKLREFVEALGIKPLIVEMLPSKGMTLTDKVKKYQQEADCAIILATRGGIIDTKSGKQHPRLNVIDELSSFWEAFPERVIVLLEKGAELPSNKSGLTYEPFARQSMDRAFIAIARELTEMKILKAVKPPKE